jgi:hypothetical protein
LFCVSAVAGGTMFYRWWRMEKDGRGRVWRLYGWFTALMACGSCVGAAAWAASMMNLANNYKGNTIEDSVQLTSLYALSYSWYAASTVTYAIEFLCLSAAKLMVLDRMSVFAAPQGTRLQTRWAAVGRVVMAAVVLGNAVGLAANAAAAVHFQKAAQDMSTASAYFAANNTKDDLDGESFFLLSQEELQRGGSIASVQAFSEMAVLLLIVVAFVVVGVLSARLVSRALREVEKMRAVQTFHNPSQAESPVFANATTQGRALRLRFVATTAFVFVAFVLRAAFSTMEAVVLQLRDTITESCPDLCDECHNAYYLMSVWMAYTPEFQLMIVFVSSPVALLVALWGMTPKTTLQLMKSSKQEAIIPLENF